MFNSVVLDVVIGLVFIYLLYSLFITILGEMAISWLGIRARILRKAIEKMLNDSYPESEKEGLDKLSYEIKDFFLLEPKEFTGSFAGKFYDQPRIKYLTRSQKRSPFLFRQSKPSYFSGRNFAETLIQLFRNGGAGINDMERIRFCLTHNTLNLQSDTLSHFKNLEHESANDLESFKVKLVQWFDETMDRASGWYKSKLRIILFLLGFFLAIAFNIDSIKIASALSKDKEARDELVKMSLDYVKDTANKSFVSIGGDTIHNQSLIDSAYAHVSKDIEDAKHVLGLGWNFDQMTKPYTYSVIKGTGPSLYETVLKNSIELTKLRSYKNEIAAKYAAGKDSFTQIANLVEMTIRDTLDLYYEVHIVKRTNDSSGLISERKSIEENIKKLKFLRMKYVSDSIFLKKADNKEKEASQSLCSLLGKDVAVIDSVHSDTTHTIKCVIFYGTRHYNTGEAALHVLRASFSPAEQSFWGFVITALALSLGAPFWFDLLRKLVSIRGGGVKPEEKAHDPESTMPLGGGLTGGTVSNKAGPGPDNKELPVDAALRLYGDEIRKEDGVLKVAQGFIKGKDDKAERCVQINVKDHDTLGRIAGKYRDLKVGISDIVRTNVVVTGKPELKANGTGNNDRAIGNQTLKLGWGSYGCVVESLFDPGKYMLSCYHVMKGDKNWGAVGDLQNIVKYGESIVATRYKGYLTNELDIAFAEITDTTAQEYLQKFPNPVNVLPVTEDILFNTKVFIDGYKSGGIEGIMVHDNWADDFEYPLDNNGIFTHRLEGLIAISTTDASGQYAISQKGDSGSVVRDSVGNAYGIVVAGDAQYTYAIKMTTILSSLGLKLA